ncbi:protein of unknown function [Pseudodesulfovibrio profundus]|uniref:Uncharacterized protein n=1 Tax=Pseudodesulfovibrio profundus TaxID=57320 RepID=A0A2C8FDX9_9BACT|nr:hypothetical protein [Pseudodesulfovibrio profundus]SOB60633.1 protein of unknown function [Pseudodesulfovibrio profundus]
MNQLGWRNKLRKVRKQRDEALAQVAELEKRGVDSGELDKLKAENESLSGELRACKMREGKLKKQLEKLKGK